MGPVLSATPSSRLLQPDKYISSKLKMYCFKSTVNTVFAILFFGKSLKPINKYIANMVKHFFHPKAFTTHSGEMMNHHT